MHFIDHSSLTVDLAGLQQRLDQLANSFNYLLKKQRLAEIQQLLIDPNRWSDHQQFQQLNRERIELEAVTLRLEQLTVRLQENAELLVLLKEQPDEQLLQELAGQLSQLAQLISVVELERMFAGPADHHHAYLDIQAGSGGTEAQDWAEMLLRMYLRFGERHAFAPLLLELSSGETAGIKSATVKFQGEYAYGWLRTETGVHRLVRKSPFDANHKRHTSFASVFVYPAIVNKIEVEINPADLRIDTYRAQGAGGQHVNKTDSAVRIKHNPTGIIVQCQSERSQHQNREQAMNQLRSRLYALELGKQQAAQDALEASKLDISWGSQIRSYVLDDSRVKDLRTGFETRNPQPVLDGDLDQFIYEMLKSQ